MSSQVVFRDRNRIRWEFKDFKHDEVAMRYSDPFKIENLLWKIGIEVRNSELWAILRCEKENDEKKLWICAATNIDFTSFMSQKNGERNSAEKEEAWERKQITTKYFTNSHKENGQKVCSKYIWSRGNTFANFANNSPIVIDIEFATILYDFSENILADMVFNVDGVQFLMNKALFYIVSDYFFNLFVTLKYAKNYFDVKNVTVDEFLSFLVAIHPTSIILPDFHREKIVELADTYKIRSIHMKNEAFLIENLNENQKVLIDSLKLAEKHGYQKLLNKCLDLLDCRETIKRIGETKEFAELGGETKAKVLQKILKFV
ncbi:unnamed protein product [Caenorhabditis angaria]|uniref:BTB domain-containing protein n=1 Tax=Caenorhabditis angaria TaxID=860376 RepID=A0A9P1I999_9PELO|nr:unnamed protein product [Caenorhabditis angaria]